MFYVFFFFNDMSSLGNVPHPCSFLLSDSFGSKLQSLSQESPLMSGGITLNLLMPWTGPSVSSRVGCEVHNLELSVTFVDLPNHKILLLFFSCSFFFQPLKENFISQHIPVCAPILTHISETKDFLFTTITKAGKSVFREVREGERKASLLEFIQERRIG